MPYVFAVEIEASFRREQYAKNLKQANDSTVRAYKEALLPESKAVRAETVRKTPQRGTAIKCVEDVRKAFYCDGYTNYC